MAGRELRALLGEPQVAVSPLLCLSQSGPSSFLRPVTVQLPLPPGVTGERGGRGAPLDLRPEGEALWGASACGPLPSAGPSLDRSRLHLLYRAPPAAAWDDITAQVALELTHLYARFQVTHFSWSVPLRLPQPRPTPPLRAQPRLTPAPPGTGSGTPPRPAWGAWRGRPGSGCGCTV